MNGKQGLVSPYVVKAIGNPTYLESGLSKKNYGYIDVQKAEGTTVTLTRQDNITIKKYEGNINFENILSCFGTKFFMLNSPYISRTEEDILKAEVFLPIHSAVDYFPL